MRFFFGLKFKSVGFSLGIFPNSANPLQVPFFYKLIFLPVQFRFLKKMALTSVSVYELSRLGPPQQPVRRRSNSTKVRRKDAELGSVDRKRYVPPPPRLSERSNSLNFSETPSEIKSSPSITSRSQSPTWVVQEAPAWIYQLHHQSLR